MQEEMHCIWIENVKYNTHRYPIARNGNSRYQTKRREELETRRAFPCPQQSSLM